MGEVYEARDLEEVAETVALKTLLPEIAGDESMIARFKQEIALSRKVAHPNVCKVFDLARHEGEDGRSIIFLTMEFLAGETLADRLRQGPMSEAEALPLIEQMAAALDAAHEAGVIHRDFKPSNVMLVPAGDGVRVAVTDFGLARRFVTSGAPTATMSNVVVGTLDYMAPELLTGSPATFASDMYALGMTAFKMMTGVLQFTADTPLAAAVMRINRAVPSPRLLRPGLDEKWERAILRALDPKPANRFGSARHFVEAVRGEQASMTLKLPVMTRRRAAIAVGVAMLAVGAVMGWREWVSASRRLAPDAQALYKKGVADIDAGAYFAAAQALQEAVKSAPAAPQVHARLAEAWVGLDLSEKASEQMLDVRREDLSYLSKLDRLQIEAIDREITREFPAAAAKYEEMTRQGGDSAELEAELGRAYENAGRPDEAIRSYLRAAEGPEHNPAAWLRLGALYARQANKNKADEAFAQAEHLYQLTSNLEGLTEVAIQQGIAATSRGELEAGAAYLQRALATARLAGNPQQEIVATLRLSTNAYLAGDTPTTERYANTALEMARRNQLDAMAIRGLVSLGNAFIRKQDFDRSERYYRDALDLARQTHSTGLAAMSLASLASVHEQKQDYGQSVSEAKEALAFYQVNGFAKETGQCLTLITRAQRASGDYEGALSSFRGMLRTAEKSKDRYAMASSHESIAGTLMQQGRYPEALEEYRQSLGAAVDDEQIGYASYGAGKALWRLGQYAEAGEAFARAQSIAAKFPRLRLWLTSDRALMLLSQGRYKPAIDLALPASAEKAAQTPELQIDLGEVIGLAWIQAGNKRAGLKKCEEAQTAALRLPQPADRLQASVALLEARVENGERESATRLFHELEPGLSGFPETQWRALALVSQVDATYSLPARETLERLSRQWGESVYNAYRTRPDVEKLSRPLLHLVSAKH